MKRCKTGGIKGCRVLELPLHLIFDILSRLTIDAIFGCKCVCKTFLEILTDPYFVELHLTKAPNTADGLIIQDRRNISNFLLVYNNRLGLANYDSRPCQTMVVPTKVSQYYNGAYIVGSCNGLLCLRYSTKNFLDFRSRIFCICNPILGELLFLPPHIQHKTFSSENVGFGFCPKTKQYKVFRFDTPSSCSIYTLGTKCWRQIGNAPYPRTVHSFDSSINGNLHWITNSFTNSKLICSFNLETEVFSYISSPVHFNQDALEAIMMSIGLLGGLFCFHFRTGEKYEAFVMEDYGPEGRWIKKFSINMGPSYLNFLGRSHYCIVVGLLNNGELICQYDSDGCTLIWCDLHNGTTRYVLAEKDVVCLDVISFVPSFVSLKAMVGVAVENVEVLQRIISRNLWSENGFKFIR